jgi:hypothetical protein
MSKRSILPGPLGRGRLGCQDLDGVPQAAEIRGVEDGKAASQTFGHLQGYQIVAYTFSNISRIPGRRLVALGGLTTAAAKLG